MVDIDFSIDPVDEKPEKQGRKKGTSKYTPLIEASLESEHNLVCIMNTGIEANYLRLQLMKVLDYLGIDSVKASVRSKEVYLEKE
jgi:hypothetical protein